MTTTAAGLAKQSKVTPASSITRKPGRCCAQPLCNAAEDKCQALSHLPLGHTQVEDKHGLQRLLLVISC
jgi:hypothetical protein